MIDYPAQTEDITCLEVIHNCFTDDTYCADCGSNQPVYEVIHNCFTDDTYCADCGSNQPA